MKISYAIPVCNEYKEIEYLLDYLVKHIRTEDEIVIQCDQGNTTPEVYEVLNKFKMDMKNIKRYNKLCFMDAAEEIGLFDAE